LAIHGVPREEFIAVDTGDGVAITFLHDIEQALMLALKLQEHLQVGSPRHAAFTVRIGINLGPVKLVKDINRRTNVIGDGINVAHHEFRYARKCIGLKLILRDDKLSQARKCANFF